MAPLSRRGVERWYASLLSIGGGQVRKRLQNKVSFTSSPPAKQDTVAHLQASTCAAQEQLPLGVGVP